jgi:hypothetical protein
MGIDPTNMLAAMGFSAERLPRDWLRGQRSSPMGRRHGRAADDASHRRLLFPVIT